MHNDWMDGLAMMVDRYRRLCVQSDLYRKESTSLVVQLSLTTADIIGRTCK